MWTVGIKGWKEDIIHCGDQSIGLAKVTHKWTAQYIDTKLPRDPTQKHLTRNRWMCTYSYFSFTQLLRLVQLLLRDPYIYIIRGGTNMNELYKLYKKLYEFSIWLASLSAILRSR